MNQILICLLFMIIKGKLHADVSKSQLSDKIRMLKKKFMTSVEYGEVPGFLLVFEYSNQIWGAPSNNVVKENVSSSANGKAKKAVTVVVKKSAEHKYSGKVSTLNKVKEDEKCKKEEKQKQLVVIEENISSSAYGKAKKVLTIMDKKSTKHNKSGKVSTLN